MNDGAFIPWIIVLPTKDIQSYIDTEKSQILNFKKSIVKQNVQYYLCVFKNEKSLNIYLVSRIKKFWKNKKETFNNSHLWEGDQGGWQFYFSLHTLINLLDF